MVYRAPTTLFSRAHYQDNCFLANGGAVMATGDSSEVAVQPELDRREATSLVFDALTAVIPGLRVEALDERQEL